MSARLRLARRAGHRRSAIALLAAVMLLGGQGAAPGDARATGGDSANDASRPGWPVFEPDDEARGPAPEPSPRPLAPRPPAPSAGPPSAASPEPSTAPTTDPASPTPRPALIEKVAVIPVPPLPAGAFRAEGYRLPRLAWSALPFNGLSLLSTSRTRRHADEQGLPIAVTGGRRFYNPGNLATQGCRYLDGYVRTGDPVYLERAERRAAKLRELAFSARGGVWEAYRASFGGMRAPWVSALAQGGALSFFVRLYRVTGNPADLATARDLFLSFRALGRSSPWVAYVDSAGYLRLEEYPSERPSHVFNGANFGYFGIYEYAMLTGDPTAIRFAQGHLTAMRHYAIRYRVPGGLSLYDLVHRAQSRHYHSVDAWQLSMLARMGGGPYFLGLSRRFLADADGGRYP